MARAATSRLKCNPPLGRMPVLQFMAPGELAVDASYQRSLEAKESQTLIRRIAQHWNWDLCQPLIVSRRSAASPLEGGASGAFDYYVIDGQHRLEAARLRKDIAQLPCVVVDYASAADEAASFVHLNQQRRPLGAIDLFKAALASEDGEAAAIHAAIAEAGLSLAAHSNFTAWKPGQVAIIGGIQRSWRREGAAVASEALQLLGTAFAGEIMRYAGTIWPGLVAVCAQEMRGGRGFDPGRFAVLSGKLGKIGQGELRRLILAGSALNPEVGHAAAAIALIGEIHWPERGKTPAPTHAIAPASLVVPFVFKPDRVGPDCDGKCWCDQCDMRVTEEEATGCKSRWCSLRKSA